MKKHVTFFIIISMITFLFSQDKILSAVSQIDNLTKQNIAQALWLDSFDESAIPSEILNKIFSQKNRNKAFADRLDIHLDELGNNKISFLKNLNKRYASMKKYADQRSPQQVYANLMLMGPQGVKGYKLLDPDMKFEWPQIDHPQWEYQVGWHFFVGNFTDEDNNHYSVQLMYWQYSLLPPDMAHELGLSDIENQIIELHLAISDPQTDTHYRANTVIVAGTTGLIDFKEKPYKYSLGKNMIRSLDPD
ncbi:MAG: lipocalin-like domain-containing protein, partial [Candidatus Marinimicrobia bacterium]|nr:lipocalin-like domain-containing protein [Candidatus Neomarinimicrobiota bacterium]